MIKWRNNNPIYDSIADRYGVPKVKLRRAFEAALPMLEAGKITTRKFLTDGLSKSGKRLRSGDPADVLWTEPFARMAKLRTGSVEIVKSLRRKGYRVFLFSNTSLPHARFLRRVGWDRLFDGFLTSCEIRSIKLSPEAFRKVLERVKAVPSEVAFIDDKEENVQGAKEFGIRWTFRFTSVARLKRDLATMMTEEASKRSDPSRVSQLRPGRRA